jgi:hypothetical protein
MPNTKCPVCAGEVPGTALRSGTFPCPICNEPLRVRDWSPLLIIPSAGCGYWLTFVIGERLGLKGDWLLSATFFLGSVGGLVVAGVLGLVWGWLFPVPLEAAPVPPSEDGGILHIESPPTRRKGPE